MSSKQAHSRDFIVSSTFTGHSTPNTTTTTSAEQTEPDRPSREPLEQQEDQTSSTRIHQHRGEEEHNGSSFSNYFQFLRKTIRTLMNAAVTIFGLGIGVGLILGDSLRHRTPVRFAAEVEEPRAGANGHLVDNSSTSPSCGRPTNRNVQEAPVSTAAALLPAQ